MSYGNTVAMGTILQQTAVLKLRSYSYYNYRYVFMPVPVFTYLISLNSHTLNRLKTCISILMHYIQLLIGELGIGTKFTGTGWGWGSQGCGPYHVPVQLSTTDLELLNFFFHTFLLEC